MRALQRLEQGGYQFELQDGKVTFHYHGHEEPPEQWAAPLLAEVREQRDEVKAILQARQDWLALYEAWCGRPTGEADDATYVSRLAELATVGLLPCYEDGDSNAGPAGWQRLADQYEVTDEHQKEVMPMSANTTRPLPWTA